MRKHKLLLLLVSCLFVNFTNAQETTETVFLIGENHDQYHALIAEYSTSLLEVCENSMEESYEVWSAAMKDIEDFCFTNDFDIKGSKLWINVFWDKTGDINNIVFHLKPNSRNIDTEKLRSLFTQYVDLENETKTFTSNYAHYGSASFPVFFANQALEK